MMFWDASAVIPLCVDEPRSEAMQAIVREDSAMAAWWGTPVECFSAFARLRRERILSEAEESRVAETVYILSDSWTEILPSSNIRVLAARILRIHPLRAADSLQMAAALTWAGENTKGQHFVCLDKRLREAALKEGFSVLPME